MKSKGVRLLGVFPPQYRPWVVCFAGALFFFFEFIQLNIFNVLGPSISQAFHIDAIQLASISDKYFLANSLCLFPAGMLLDRVSTRRAILLGMLVSVICTFGFSQATVIWHLKIVRFLIGVVASFCMLGCVRLASRWFPTHQLALVIGLSVTLAMLGGLVAQTPVAVLNAHVGWRTTVMIDALLGVVLLLFIYLGVEDYPPSSSGRHPIVLYGKEFRQGLLKALKNSQNWLGGLYTSLMNLPVFLLGALWGVFYLTQVHHFTDHQSSLITSCFFFGVLLGSPCLGWLSDRIRRRKAPMIIGAGFSLVIILFLIFKSNLNFTDLLLLFFFMGFISSTQIITYPLIAESNPAEITATAEGIASVLIMAGGFSQHAFAYLMQTNWSGHSVNGIPHYSLTDYRIGMMIMPVAFLISLILAICLKETYCRQNIVR